MSNGFSSTHMDTGSLLYGGAVLFRDRAFAIPAEGPMCLRRRARARPSSGSLIDCKSVLLLVMPCFVSHRTCAPYVMVCHYTRSFNDIMSDIHEIIVIERHRTRRLRSLVGIPRPGYRKLTGRLRCDGLLQDTGLE